MRYNPEFERTTMQGCINAKELIKDCTNCVNVTNNCCDARKARTTAWNDTNVFVGILASFITAIGHIIQVGDGLPQG